jgi:hypothetical protein
MWQFGPAGLVNCHIVIKWGIRDPTVAARLCWAYLARAKAWARAGETKLRPQRRSRRYGTLLSFSILTFMNLIAAPRIFRC